MATSDRRWGWKFRLASSLAVALDITASGILGTQFRSSETRLNDITASSEFGAAGVVTMNSKGEVMLVAQASTLTPHSPKLTPTSCHAR